MQADNNLALYDQMQNILWSTNTNSIAYLGSYVVMQDDGNLVLYDSQGISHWASNTRQSEWSIFLNQIKNV